MQKKIFFLLTIITILFAWSSLALAAEAENISVGSATIDIDSPNYDITGNWQYTLMHEIIITNSGLGMAFNVTVSVPLMDDAELLYTSLVEERQNPIPATIRIDEHGHRIAEYTIPYIYGNQSVSLIQRFAINVSTLGYHVNRANTADSYSQNELNELSQYLQPTDTIQSTAPEIIAFTNSIISGVSNPYQKAKDLFGAVNLLLSYTTIDPDQSALATLNRATAHCQGYTNLYIACLRAAGIPARQQSGYLYLPQTHTTTEYIDQINQRIYLNKTRHTWVEFYLPDKGWIVADPTFTYTFAVNGTVQKFVDWDYFANIEMERRYIAFQEEPVDNESIDYSATGGRITESSITFNAYLLLGVHWESFNDIGDHWAQEAITTCVNNKLFTGLSNYTFGPDQPMTRAMFITVTGRLYEMLSGEIIGSSAPSSFNDIDATAYYAKYLNWGVDNQIITGYGNNRFGPDDNVTREQMAKIITVFAELMGENTEIYTGAMTTFADGEDIASWAKDPVSYCNAAGIISGMPGNMFNPGHLATRAQVATIMQRLIGLLNE